MLIRPGIFIIARLAVFILRAIMAKGNYGIGFFSASPPHSRSLTPKR